MSINKYIIVLLFIKLNIYNNINIYNNNNKL